jgi:hypothetical protein
MTLIVAECPCSAEANLNDFPMAKKWSGPTSLNPCFGPGFLPSNETRIGGLSSEIAIASVPAGARTDFTLLGPDEVADELPIGS